MMPRIKKAILEASTRGETVITIVVVCTIIEDIAAVTSVAEVAAEVAASTIVEMICPKAAGNTRASTMMIEKIDNTVNKRKASN